MATLSAIVRRRYTRLPVPVQFSREFPHASPVRPSQIRAESQDAVMMMPAVDDLEERLRTLKHPGVHHGQ
jgi:hypothetical protein